METKPQDPQSPETTSPTQDSTAAAEVGWGIGWLSFLTGISVEDIRAGKVADR
jgi:hypothetical protein